jgi:RHS repeat-associated protein
LTQNEYDELGQLIRKRVAGTDVIGEASLQKVDYLYNIRGWLTNINHVDKLTPGSDPTDLFAFKISYNEVTNDLAGKIEPLFNGNISETFWKTAMDNIKRNYGYQYDALNRLTGSIYQKNGLETNSYNEFPTYDKNGNITTMYRTGYQDESDQVMPFEIDKLVYGYASNSNKLLSVHDHSHSTNGFKDGNVKDNDYEYDAYGNMILDRNKNIESITYNHLNLPTEIDFGDSGIIYYIYNAIGVKVGKTFTTNYMQQGTVVSKTDYLGGFQYLTPPSGAGGPQFFPTAEGYVKVTDGGKFNYVYNYTDHLGNIRVSYSLNPADGELKILEENHYYPFGLKHSNYNVEIADFDKDETGIFAILKLVERKDYQYKYNGQEWQDELGLNVTAMDYRQYDNALGRFNSIDALSEMQYSHTPYHFGYNNPVFWADPTGLISEEAIAGMWNATADGTNSYWYNSGSGMTSDDLGGGTGGNVDFGTGEFTGFESLGNVNIVRNNRGDSSFIGQLTSHIYSQGKYYDSFRAQNRTKAHDDVQEYFGMLGAIDPFGIIDGFNALGYGLRGQKANAAVAAIAILPFGVLAKGAKLWSKTKKMSSVQNAYGHFKKHGAEFPEFYNAKQYVEGTISFLHNSPSGTLMKVRGGDILKYHPATNTFGVITSEGVPKTMFRPDDGMDYWLKQ